MSDKLFKENKTSQEEHFQIEWIKKYGVNPVEVASKENQDMEHYRAENQTRPNKKIKSQDIVDEEIDLHGEDIGSGLCKLEEIILRAKKYGHKSIRIIHGVGPSGAGVQTMRLSIKHFLNTKAKGWIKKWNYDNPTQGSLIIYFE